MGAAEAVGPVPTTAQRRLVVFVGPPGSGKTTVGRTLASRWRVAFRDTDSDVEATAGLPVADIFIEYDEPYFRKLEADAVLAALEGHVGVLALGGGAVMDPATRSALAGHIVVHLDVGVADAVRRVGLARDRPLLVEAPRARLAAMLTQRRPFYAEVATITVDTSGRTPQQVADEVEQLLRDNGHGTAGHGTAFH